MSDTLHIIVWLTAYALGCFNTGYYWVRLKRRQDIREFGSGSTGARNVGRLLGPSGFIITFTGDIAKACLALTFGILVVAPSAHVFWCLPALVIGHIYPAQLGFRGGKGIAVALGGALTLAAFTPHLNLKAEAASIIAASILTLALILFAHRSHLAKKRMTWQSHPHPKASAPESRL
jgi:acyl-phosphate glycerol 3-phosphate acyltransferase